MYGINRTSGNKIPKFRTKVPMLQVVMPTFQARGMSPAKSQWRLQSMSKIPILNLIKMSWGYHLQKTTALSYKKTYKKLKSYQ